MITPSQKEKIVKVLSKHYSGKILSFLGDKNIQSRYGNALSPTYIRQIVCGSEENKFIEDKIFELVKMTVEDNKAEEKKREKMLKSLKI